MKQKYDRQIAFDNVLNFRDLGGLRARDGRAVARRRVYRSAEFAGMTRSDLDRLTGEIGLATIIDLRSTKERENQGIGLLSGANVRIHNISLLTRGDDVNTDEKHYSEFPDMGEFYVYLTGSQQFSRRLIEALEIIAAEDNHPLVFHCAVGKDRTGLLAAVLLSALGVRDEDVIEDYAMSAPHMVTIIERMNSKPETAERVKRIPAMFWGALPESMARLLAEIRKAHGSTAEYLKENGADASLVARLEKALLV
jgi:protein-tyrosine phosphatase